MRTWSRSLTKEGPSVTLTEVPFWAWAAQELGEYLEEGSHSLGACLIDPPEWAWKVKWGPDDAEGYNPRSLGHAMNRFGNSLLSGFGAWRHEKNVRVPVSREWIERNYPGDTWWNQFEDDDAADEGCE